MKTKLSELTHDDIRRILDIVNGIDNIDFQLQLGEVALRVRKGNVAEFVSQDAVAMSAAAGSEPTVANTNVSVNKVATDILADRPADKVIAATPPQASEAQGLIDIVAPMVGRFYSRQSPADPVLVQVGTKVEPEDDVCLLEVMKLFSTVQAGVTGEIAEVLREDGDMVEEGEVLFRVRAS